jgi:hypothetical protein
VTAWQSPINLPSPLLNLISEAVKHQGEPVVISSLLSQLATPLYVPLQPDQRFERVCCFHGSRPVKSRRFWKSGLGEIVSGRPACAHQLAASSMLFGCQFRRRGAWPK